MKARIAPSIAIACGGTGGHLFPGLAVADYLAGHSCVVTLIVSPKDVDQEAVKNLSGMDILTLPAVGLSRGHAISFLRGFIKSYRLAKRHFRTQPPQAVLAMGGFTSAPPVLAARKLGVQTFIHESNIIPGRANRWLSKAADRVFVGFPEAGSRLPNRNLTASGTPVRPQFQLRDGMVCRVAVGLQPTRPVLLVMGGSQGASAINDTVINMLPLLAKNAPELQLFHLTGPKDARKIQSACSASSVKAVVHPFFTEMDLALGAATVAISRAGASSLAELAAMRLPAVLIPYPAATDNHQFHNAHAFEESGAARLMDQKDLTPETLARSVLELVENAEAREKMRLALAQWHSPRAAELIGDEILAAVIRRSNSGVRPNTPRRRRRSAPDSAAEQEDVPAA